MQFAIASGRVCMGANLEELAIRYLMLGEIWQTTIGISLSAVGFIMALVAYRNRSWSIRRVPYFILATATILVVSTFTFAWLLTYKAMANGMFWLLTLLIFLGAVLGGHVLGALAHARSVNGYGSGKAAWLGMVPLLNLVLLFVEPVERAETRWAGPIVSFLGTMLGIALFFSSGFVQALSVMEVERLAQQAAVDPSFRELRLKMLIISQGLDVILAKDASTAKPIRIDNEMTLRQIQATGTHLRYIYEFTGSPDNLAGAYRQTLTQSNCISLHGYIEAGATIEHQFLRPDGTEADLVAIPPSACGY
jgi:hypothetical protein